MNEAHAALAANSTLQSDGLRLKAEGLRVQADGLRVQGCRASRLSSARALATTEILSPGDWGLESRAQDFRRFRLQGSCFRV